MTKKLSYLIISVILLIVALFMWQYVIAVYEVRFTVTPGELYADNSSKVEIYAIPINSFGFKAPFRNAEISYAFELGKELVDVEESQTEGKITFKAKDTPGIVAIFVKSNYSLMRTKIEIVINSNFT